MESRADHARNPQTTYCITVTDEQGHAIGHGCARPEPKNRIHTGKRAAGHDPPGGPAFTFTASGDEGPPSGYGAWRLSTGITGRRDLLIELDPIALDTCDHRFGARGMIRGSSCGT